MAKLPIIIADYTNQSRISGGVANRTVAHFDELAVVGSQVAAGNVSGGVLPMSSDEYAAAMLASLGASPAAWFRADTGVTVTGQGAAQVNDQANSDHALVLPGVAGNYASTPDSVANSITGDIDIRVRASANAWTPATAQMLASKYAAGQISWYVQIGTTGNINFQYTTDGSTTAGRLATSSAVNGFTDGDIKWVRVTYASATGKVNFYTASDSSSEPSAWSALGVEQTITSGAIFDGTAPVEVGSFAAGTQALNGRAYRALVYSGISGTLKVDFNAADFTKGSTSATSSTTGEVWTVNQSGNPPAHIGNKYDLLQVTDASRPPYLSYSGTKYLYCPNAAANYATTPSAAANKITGDIDIRARIAANDYTIAATQYICSKYGAAGNKSYLFGFEGTSTGKLQLQWTADGTTLLTTTSTVSAGLTDGTAYWVRATMDVNDGAGNRVVKFYTAADSETEPTSWTQLGTTVTTAGTTSIFDSTYDFQVSSFTNGTAGGVFIGKIYRVALYNGYDGAGTKTVDFNPNADASDGSTSFASSATGETWTVNSSGGLPAQIVGRPSLLFDGTADYLKCNAFTLNQPETVYLAFKQVSWTLNDAIFDGNTLSSGSCYQNATTPRFRINAGATVNENANLAVGSYGAACIVFNGANSLTQVNLTTAVTGDAGAGNMGGFTLGANGTPGAYSNIQVLEVILAAAAHDSSTRARVIQYLSGRHGIAL